MKILVLFFIFIGVGSCTDNIGGTWNNEGTKYNDRVTNIGYQGSYGEEYYNQNEDRQEYLDRKGDKNNQFDVNKYNGRINLENNNDQLYDKYDGPREYTMSYNNRNGDILIDDDQSNLGDRRKCDGKSKDCVERDGKKDDNRYANDKNRDSGRNEDYYNDQDWYNKEDRYDNLNLVGLGQNDTEDVVRPCALDDWQCIRQYLAKNSKCKPAYGPIPDPLYLRRNTVYFPNLNVTVIITRLKVEGLSSIRISEFYVNRDTGNLVLALNFKNVKQTSPRTYFRFHRRAKESIVGSDFAAVEFDSGTFTAVIPKIPNLRLDLADVHADIDNPRPPVIFGPGAINSTDPAVASALARVLVDLPTSVQEGFLFQSQLFTAIYIQEYLCDFGLKIISI